MLFGIPWKFILIGLAALAIVAAIGGYFWTQKSIVENLQDTVTKQAKEITGLQTEKANLTAEVERKVKESEMQSRELNALRMADSNAQSAIRQLEKQLRDADRIIREKTVRQSDKADLYLRLQNRTAECFWENFERADGRCVAGKWLPNKESK
jgi:uncharacterized protein YoxC